MFAHFVKQIEFPCIYYVLFTTFSEFTKRLDPDLPFYLWTSDKPYNEDLPDFDDDGTDPDNGDHNYGGRRGNQRLHTFKRNTREDPSLFVPGRSLIPTRHAPALRQRLFAAPAALPDIPIQLLNLQ